jgi:hypothetical protein
LPRHVFKSGGTTITLQTGGQQLSLQDPEIAKRKWLTFVRDPIDHFLSGWAECGSRSRKGLNASNAAATYDEGLNASNAAATYDEGIQQWLEQTKNETTGQRCAIHSFPQANFMLDATYNIAYEQLELVGDLLEMANVLESIGFPYDPKKIGRNASQNVIKQQQYPVRKDLISDKIMRAICDFVAIDYYLFDFEPPAACKGLFLRNESQSCLVV